MSSPILNPHHDHVINEKLTIFSDKRIGSGAFGAVFEGTYEGRPCAIKLLHHTALEIQANLPAGLGNETAIKAFDRECAFLRSIKHRNIVRHLSTDEHPTSGSTVLVTELMDYNLRSYLSDLGDKSLTSYHQLRLSKDIATGLAFIHCKQIIHRDLCGDNILLTLRQPVPMAKISDFGMSRLVDPSRMSHTLTAVAHRMGYLPPEALRLDDEKYDQRLDVFSLGVIMVQIVCKVETVKTVKDRLFHVQQIPEAHVLKPVINNCLKERMERRPYAGDICDTLERLLQRWGKPMPFGMSNTVQSVAIGNTVYVGGGYADAEYNSCMVMKFDLQQDEWTTLPQYSARWFAMTSLYNQLLLVGGCDPNTWKSTNQIAALDLESERWTQQYPPMSTARHSSTAACFNNHIIVAGGWDDYRRTNSVEALNLGSRRWYNAKSLPCPRSELKSVVVENTLYLMGGWDQAGSTKVVHKVDLNELISNAVNYKDTDILWQTTKEGWFKHSTPLTIEGFLLAVGGEDNFGGPSSSIHCYYPDNEIWWKVGDLPFPLYYCSCSVIPSGEVMVAGGRASHGNHLDTVSYISVTV